MIAIVYEGNDLFVFICLDIDEDTAYRRNDVEKFLTLQGVNLIYPSAVQMDKTALDSIGFLISNYNTLDCNVFAYKMTVDNFSRILQVD